MKQGLQALRPGGALVLHIYQLYITRAMVISTTFTMVIMVITTMAKNFIISTRVILFIVTATTLLLCIEDLVPTTIFQVLVGCVTPNTAIDITGEQVGFVNINSIVKAAAMIFIVITIINITTTITFQVVRKCATLVGIHNYCGEDLEDAVKFLERTKLKPQLRLPLVFKSGTIFNSTLIFRFAVRGTSISPYLPSQIFIF